jgi:hypothetical protein
MFLRVTLVTLEGRTFALGLLISPPPKIAVWAFVSVTNNATQQVTTITPQP